MKIKDVLVISVSVSDSSYVLVWTTADARYHIWLRRPAQRPSDDILYKNPPRGVVHRGEGWFDTRHLKSTDKANNAVVAYVLAEAQKRDLFHQAEIEQAFEDAARENAYREGARIARIKETGPMLLDAAKGVVEYLRNPDSFTITQKAVRDSQLMLAIAEAEKKS